jgi:GDP/UDP-N,N'-diacetylbacillosamine 2-epimerase (hydrolysing)
MVHIHFTACEDHRKRLIKMGEEPFRIFNVGNPALDRIRTTPHLNRKELSKILNFDIGKHEPLIIILQHPLSSESESAYKQMKITMESVKELGIKAVVIYPNTDPGSYNIVTVIEEYHDLPNVKICKNLKRLEFVNLMRHASCLVGNSSCGLVEAPFLELPAINIGNRQKGRLNAGNVIFVPHKKEIIVDIIKKVVFNKNFRKKLINNIDNIYGDGHTKEKIVNVLEKIKINNKLLIKRNTY